MRTIIRRAIAGAVATAGVVAIAGTADASTPAVCSQVMADECGHADYWPHGFPPPAPSSWPTAPR